MSDLTKRALHVAGRASLITLGLEVYDKPRDLARYRQLRVGALVAAVAIEVLIIGWTAMHPPALPAPTPAP